MVLIMLTFLALRPPSVGAMLVIPLRETSQGALVNIALRQGGSLFGAGPIAGSLIVFGDRAELQPAFWRVGAIMFAAPAFACGDLPSRTERNAAE